MTAQRERRGPRKPETILRQLSAGIAHASEVASQWKPIDVIATLRQTASLVRELRAALKKGGRP